mgnify:CR=1 FL=1
MAVQTRYAGDANGVNNVNATYDGTLATVVSTGLTKNPIPFSIKLGKSQTFAAADSATGGVIETFLKQIAVDSTITMYQVDSGQLSVLLEACGSNVATIATRIQALGNATVAGGSNIWANVATITNVGFKLATS